MSPGVRRTIARLIMVAGVLTFLSLLWRFDPARVASHLIRFGWGFAVLLPFQILDHALNAWGWRLAFTPESARQVRFWDLVRVRIAGDGVNYLTPSANLGGEFIRPGMLDYPLSQDDRVTSVIVAKVTQTVGQTFFILSGLGYLAHSHLFNFKGAQAMIGAFGVGGILLGLMVGIGLLVMDPPAWIIARFPRVVESSGGVRALLKLYLKRHPDRLLGSIALFMLGYLWGAAEIWIICRFLGLPVTVETALSIEFLSSLIDSLSFWVPAKLGTQEAGKTAIFVGLGLPPEMGFTLGLIRHVRELTWAGFGLMLYAAHQRRGRLIQKK